MVNPRTKIKKTHLYFLSVENKRAIKMKKLIYETWSVVMDHEKNPLRHIPNTATRHMIMQILAWMWCIVFGMIVGSWFVVGVSLIGHLIFIGAIGITVATFETAKRKPNVFVTNLRGKGGEHE